VRLDVLLFELRLFKSRSQATAAIQDGRVLLDGAAVKPSREVRAGQRVTLVKGVSDQPSAGARTFEVVELPRSGLSREAARALMRELAE